MTVVPEFLDTWTAPVAGQNWSSFVMLKSAVPGDIQVLGTMTQNANDDELCTGPVYATATTSLHLDADTESMVALVFHMSSAPTGYTYNIELTILDNDGSPIAGLGPTFSGAGY